MEVKNIKITDIKPYPKNQKKHPREQIELVKKSLKEFGFQQPLVLDKDNVIIVGHCRFEASKELGIEEVPCVIANDLTPEQIKAYRITDNRSNESDWDYQALIEELQTMDEAMKELTGFTEEDLNGLKDDIVGDDNVVVEDEYEPEVPIEPKSKFGEIYQLGDHRLMCGDSTDEKCVAQLMNGKTADLLYTDPLYNVAISNSQGMTIENDNMNNKEFFEFLDKAFICANNSLKPGGSFYVWYASRKHINFENALRKNNLYFKEQLIWVKNSFTFGRQDYKWQHEPCLYGWKDGEAHYFVEEFNHPTVIDQSQEIEKMKKEDLVKILQEIRDNTPVTVIHEDKPLKNDLHPTMKPLTICGQMIRNSSRKGAIVLDLFGGSGSTMMACEQLNRTCYMMEYDPKYVDVIIDRWELLTGKKAVKIN